APDDWSNGCTCRMRRPGLCNDNRFDFESLSSVTGHSFSNRVECQAPGIMSLQMEEFALDLHNSAVADIDRQRLSLRDRVSAYWELTKPRITFLIVLTSAAGFDLGSRSRVDYLGLVSALFGIALLSSGIATLNQYAERD